MSWQLKHLLLVLYLLHQRDIFFEGLRQEELLFWIIMFFRDSFLYVIMHARRSSFWS